MRTSTDGIGAWVADCGSVGDDELAGEDGAGATEAALPGEESHEGKDGDEGDEFDEAGGLVLGQGSPEDEQHGVCSGDGPDGAVEVAALRAFAFGGDADTREPAADPRKRMMAQSGP